MKDKLSIPRLSLVLLIGPTGSGKSTFAAKHFAASETLSTDQMRAMIDDNPHSAPATSDAQDLLRQIATRRLSRGRLTVIDAPNLNVEERRPLLKLAQKCHAAPIAIVFNVDKDTCAANNASRGDDKPLQAKFIDKQHQALEKAIGSVKREGCYRIRVLSGMEEVDRLTIERETMRSDRCDDTGPFDIIGDVHGCLDELQTLLGEMGYAPDDSDGVWRHPEGRKAVFLGDVVNRGPHSIATLILVKKMVEAGSAYCLPGNHENLLLKWITGTTFPPANGLRETLDEIDHMSADEWATLKPQMAEFLKSLESHLILDHGRLVVAHAGMTEEMAGRMNVKRFALYGETRGETDGFSRRRIPLWALRYRAKARTIYGHTAVVEPKRSHNTLNIDTGCVFGGKLTALRYPEGQLIEVPAAKVYFQPDSQHQKPTDHRDDKAADERDTADEGEASIHRDQIEEMESAPEETMATAATEAPVTEDAAPAPTAEETTPAPTAEETTPAPTAEETTPAPASDEAAPVSDEAAPVSDEAAPASEAPAPVSDEAAPEEQPEEQEEKEEDGLPEPPPSR